MGFVSQVAKATRPLAARIGSMVKRAILERINDSEGVQLLQVSLLGDEVQDRCEHLQPYGLSFHPPRKSEAVALAVQGDGSHRVILGVSSRKHRPRDVEEGEGGLYYLGEWKVFLDKNGHVHLGAQEGAAKLARADRVDDEIERIWDLLTGWTVSPQDGGAALQTAAETAVEQVESTASDTVHGT
ncbi:MAG: phage baseplate assembly protein domain-containing protein [Myxococcota bacterium]